MKCRNATRVADAGDEMSSEGEAVWLLLSRGMVFASGCGCFAALVLLCFVLLQLLQFVIYLRLQETQGNFKKLTSIDRT